MLSKQSSVFFSLLASQVLQVVLMRLLFSNLILKSWILRCRMVLKYPVTREKGSSLSVLKRIMIVFFLSLLSAHLDTITR